MLPESWPGPSNPVLTLEVGGAGPGVRVRTTIARVHPQFEELAFLIPGRHASRLDGLFLPQLFRLDNRTFLVWLVQRSCEVFHRVNGIVVQEQLASAGSNVHETRMKQQPVQQDRFLRRRVPLVQHHLNFVHADPNL